MAIAEQWIGLARGNEDCFDERCKVYGFGCTSRNTGYESAETRCTWGSREVRFEHELRA